MSAFAGLIGLDGAPVSAGSAERLAAALTGPGFAAAAITHTSPGCAVAFRQRLILPQDRVERSLQPDPVTGILSLFDGRLDNRDTLLQVCGGGAAGTSRNVPLSDADIAVLAYRHWGAEAPAQMLGDFAWAVWDAPAGRLLLARDHSIHRSLFFWRRDGLVAFATGFRGLFALPEVPRVLNENRIIDIIATTPDTSDASLYHDIHGLRPAEQVVITRDGLRQHRFWTPPKAASEGPTRSDDAILQEGRALFDQAVACRNRSAGPAVVLTSGGLDSSGIAATLARQMAPATVHALTLVPADTASEEPGSTWYRDERPLVEAIAARHPNLQVEYLASDAVEQMELDPTPLFMTTDVVLRGSANTAWYQRAWRRAADLRAPVVLTGGHGNITFSPSGVSRLSGLLQEGSVFGFLHEYFALRRYATTDTWLGWGQAALGSYLPRVRELKRALAGRGWADEWRKRTALNPDFLQDARFHQHYLEHAVLRLDIHAPGGRHAEFEYLFQRTQMQVEAQAALRLVSGITQTDPFADRRVIEFCLSLPDNQFFRAGRPRDFARRIFADRLPEAVIENQRRGEQNSDWYLRLPAQRDELAATLDRLERSSMARRILDLPRLRRMFDEMPANPADLRRTGNAYKVMFSRAIHVGRFLAWYEGTN